MKPPQSAECVWCLPNLNKKKDLVPLWAVALGSVFYAEGLEIRCPCPSFLGAVIAGDIYEVYEPSEKEMQSSDHFSLSKCDVL